MSPAGERACVLSHRLTDEPRGGRRYHKQPSRSAPGHHAGAVNTRSPGPCAGTGDRPGLRRGLASLIAARFGAARLLLQKPLHQAPQHDRHSEAIRLAPLLEPLILLDREASRHRLPRPPPRICGEKALNGSPGSHPNETRCTAIEARLAQAGSPRGDCPDDGSGRPPTTLAPNSSVSTVSCSSWGRDRTALSSNRISSDIWIPTEIPLAISAWCAMPARASRPRSSELPRTTPPVRHGQPRTLTVLWPAGALLQVRGGTNGQGGVAGSIPAGLHTNHQLRPGPTPGLFHAPKAPNRPVPRWTPGRQFWLSGLRVLCSRTA
jgi:hypothetical protein